MTSRPTSPPLDETEAFLRALLHAARNAMQRGQTALSLLRLEAAERPELLDLIAEAERGSDSLTALFDAARLHLARLTVDVRPVDVAAVIRQAWSDMEMAADARLAIEPDALQWPLDAAVFGAALQALFRNAAQARPRGLLVRARLLARATAAGEVLDLHLLDNGPGLGETPLAHALEPFWSTRPGALGMGLASARKAIEAHAGTLSLQAGDDGAHVLVTLPAAAG